MATKLKNMRLTSVDLVRNGANQEADICLFKSADPAEDPVQPTTEEKNIFKRFINWIRENPAEENQDDEETVEKDYTTFDSLNAARENNEKLWQYTSALTESIRSIQMDQDLAKDQKYKLMSQSLDQFDAAMDDLIKALSGATPPSGIVKSVEEDDDEVEIDETVEKFNPYHDARGRFTTGGGGSGGGGGRRNIDEETDEILAIERELAGSRSPASSGAAAGGKYSAKDFQGSQAVADAVNGLDKELRDRGKAGVQDFRNGAYGQATLSLGKFDSVGVETNTDGKFDCYRWNGNAYKTPKYLADARSGKRVPDYVDQIGKSADFDEIEDEETVEKFNENHDPATGRFAPKGGGGSLRGSDVRNFGVPGHSGSYSMNKKEKNLARQIIETEELELEVKDSTDAYGNKMTVIHGSREDYATFKDVWGMVAPSLKKSADFDEIEEV